MLILYRISLFVAIFIGLASLKLLLLSPFRLRLWFTCRSWFWFPRWLTARFINAYCRPKISRALQTRSALCVPVGHTFGGPLLEYVHTQRLRSVPIAGVSIRTNPMAICAASTKRYFLLTYFTSANPPSQAVRV